MKRKFSILCLCILLVMLCLPASARGDFLDMDADPPVIASAGSFENHYKTRMDFSYKGGKLTGANWQRTQGFVAYYLTGTCKVGDEIYLNLTGTQSPVPDTNDKADLVFNYMNMSLKVFDVNGKLIGEEQKYFSDYVKKPTITSAMGSRIPSGAVKAEITGSFTCRWATPHAVAVETVAVSIKLTVEKEPTAALPVAPTSGQETKPEPKPDPPNQGDPAPVVHIVDDPVGSDSGEETTAVKTAAIIGIAATMAALGAAGAAGAGGTAAAAAESAAAQQAAEEAARHKNGDFRMVVYKTFGDTIEYEKPDQEVYARIESADPATGMWLYDAAKSMAISISLSPSPGLSHGQSKGLPGKGRGLSLAYKNASPQPDAQTTLSFRYTAPDGGYFERRMVFKLAGKPEIIIEKKINILSTEPYYDLPYRLVGCGENPEFDFSCPQGHIKADLSVGCDEKERFLRVSPGEDAVEWDRTAFMKPVKCTFEVKFGDKPEDIILADLEITICYEGIGTAYDGLQPDKVPADEDIMHCDPDSDKRFDRGVWLPLVVMKWDGNARTLKHDISLTEALSFEFELDKTSVDYSDSEKLNQAQSAFDDVRPKRERTSRPRPAEFTTVVDSKNNPLTYVLHAGNNAAGSADPLPVSVTVSTSDPVISPLMLSLKIQFSNDLREYIRRFFTYSENTFARSFASFGNVNRYLAAMDFIEDHVYKVSSAPFPVRMNDNHYEDGTTYEDYSHKIKSAFAERHRAVILKDDCYPRHGNDMRNIQSLVHELTHAIEHMNNDTGQDGDERHSYFLQYASDAFNKLADIERGMYADLKASLTDVINKIYRSYNNEDNTDAPRQLTWFGADMPPTQHYFIDKYINEFPSYHQSPLSQEQRQQVAETLSSLYFPLEVMGYYREETGPFKGTVWAASWKDGALEKFIPQDNDQYLIRLAGRPRWLGGNKAILRAEIEVTRKGKIDFEAQKIRSQEIFTVELGSAGWDTYDMNNPVCIRRDDLVIRWYPHDSMENSMIYGSAAGNCYVSPLTPYTRPANYNKDSNSVGNR